MKALKRILANGLGWPGLFIGIFWACNNMDLESPTGPTGSLQLAFDNVVGTQDLQMGTGVYTNGSGENFTVNTLNYYVTNIRLQRAFWTHRAA
ncbi:MbnP family protein [Larkinella sp. VNQ87]|uniref:MbnP family protein n=1 Tax=Larkinella sp. VNQ87 TaxID=3400921 RepID=UPI003C068A2A